jgi:hypothetical protein
VQGEHDNEPSGSITFWEILEWLHNWQLLKKGSDPLVSEPNMLTHFCFQTVSGAHKSYYAIGGGG